MNTGYYGGHNVVAIEFNNDPKCSKGGHLTKHNIKLNLPLSTREYNKLRKIKPFDFIAYRKKKNIEAAEERKLKRIEEKKSEPINLDVDTILDKISKFGVNSLSKIEKDFLDSL